MNPKILKFVVAGLIVLFSVFLDQWSKDWADTNLASPRFPEHTVSVTVENVDNTPTLQKLIDVKYPKNPEAKNREIANFAKRDGNIIMSQDSLNNGDKIELGYVGLTVIEDYYDYEYARNKGAAFSFLAEKSDSFRSIFFNVTGFVAIILILGFIGFTSWKKNKVVIISLACVLGGAVGNVIDRIRLGYVIDFISWHTGTTWAWPTFNIADVFVTGGVAFLLLDMLIQTIAEKRSAKKAALSEAVAKNAEADDKNADKSAEAVQSEAEKPADSDAGDAEKA